MAFKVGAIYADMKLNTKEFMAGVSKVTSQNKQMAATASATSGQFGGMWKSMAMGVGIAAGVGLAVRTLANQFSDMIAKGREFESAWSDVWTLMDMNEAEANDMRDALIDLSPALGDTTDLAKGMYDVISAGIPEDAAMMVLEEAAMGAKAGVTDVATSVDALTTVLNAYGLAQGDANDILEASQDVSNLLFQTVEDGKIRYEELAGSLGTVVPIAANTGVKFEELTAAIATMTKQGVPAQTTTMQLRQILSSILGPSKEAAELMDDLGIAYGKNALEAQGLAGWLKEMEEKTQGNVDTQNKLIPNIRAFSGVLSITGKSAEAYNTALENQRTALKEGGVAHAAFDKKMQDFNTTIETLEAAVDKFKISFYDGFVDGIESGIPGARDFDELVKTLNDTFKTFGWIVGTQVIAPLNKFNQGVKDIQKPFKAWKLLITDTVKLLKQKKLPTMKNINEMYERQKFVTEDLDDAVGIFKDGLSDWIKVGKGVVETIKEGINPQHEEAKGKVEDLGTAFKDNADEMLDWFTQIADGSLTVEEFNMKLAGIPDTVIQLKRDLEDAEILEPAEEDLMEFNAELENMPDIAKGVFQDINKNIQTEMAVFSLITGIPLTNFQLQYFDINEKIKDKTKTTTTEVDTYWDTLTDGLKTQWSNMFAEFVMSGDLFKGDFKSLVDSIAQMFSDMIGNMISKWMTNFVDQLVSGASNVGSAISSEVAAGIDGGAAGNLAGSVSNVGQQLASIANPVTAIASAVSAIANLAALGSKPKGFSEHMWYLRETQENTQEMRDYMFIEQWKMLQYMISRFHVLHDQLMKVNDKLKAMRNYLFNKQEGFLSAIADNTAKIAKDISKLKGAQTGHVSTATELVMVHGTPSVPEITLPATDLSSILASRGGSQTVVNIVVHDQLDPNTAQRITRNQVVPQILDSLDAHHRIDDWKQRMGVSI